MFFKVIACEIAVRELCFAAAGSSNLVDLEFLTQGHYDTPAMGQKEIQKRIDAVPSGKYDAILLGYGLCSNILVGLTSGQTQLIIPRAHDCITLFLGSKQRYQQCFAERPGTYYFTSGWLECARRRGEKGWVWGGASMPASANLNFKAVYDQWVRKYGEDQARYLLAEMSRWATAYTHGTLIDFEFLKDLPLAEEIQKICGDKGWEFDRIAGNLILFEKLLAGEWPEADFLVVPPGKKVAASFDESVIRAE
jgi:hypothetical protein